MYQLLFVIGGIFLLPFLPILYLQGRWIRRRLPVPIAATGSSFGTCAGNGAPLQILIIGESTVAGVGVQHYKQTISAKMASALATLLQRTVHWQAIGKIGAKVAFVRKNVVRQIDSTADYKVIVILLGANDSIQLTPPNLWVRELFILIQTLQTLQPQAFIYVGTLPPVAAFRSIPQPTRFFLSLHNRLLSSATRQILSLQPGVAFSKLAFNNVSPDFFSEDGVHPSEKGYAQWAAKIAEELASFLQKS